MALHIFMPVQWAPDQYSIPLHKSPAHPQTFCVQFPPLHLPGHHSDRLKASQYAPLLPQCQGVHIATCITRRESDSTALHLITEGPLNASALQDLHGHTLSSNSLSDLLSLT